MGCNSSCVSCSGSLSTQCSSCGTNKYLSNGSCLACDTSCLTCTTSSTTCTSCTNILYNSKCYTTCPTGLYSATVSSVLTCLACNSNCLTCSTTSTYCTTCPTASYLSNNTCIFTCLCNYFIIFKIYKNYFKFLFLIQYT